MMKKPIKIAFDASPLLVNKTGVAYYIEQLVTQIAAHHPDVELIGFYYNFLGKRSAGHFPKAANIRYRPVRLIPSKVVYQLRRFGIEIPLELLVKERTDFVLFGNFLGYPSLFHTPAAPVVHDLTYIDLPDYVAAKNRSDLTRFVPQQIKRSQFVITVSEFSKRKIVSEYQVPTERVLVTPIPAQPPIKHNLRECQQILAAAGITRPYILFLGTIEPRKNVVSLIDAYAALPETIRKQYSLVLAGRIGWNCDREVARLQKAEQEGLDVIHLGYVSEQQRAVLYQSATVFATASHYEGFGMPVLEAMSYGVACAASDIDVFHEVAANSAVYFDQNNHHTIAAALESLLTNTEARKHLAATGLHRAKSYRWDKVAQSVVSKIKTTLSRQTQA